MQPWILSDGTKVYLGGNVSGDSLLAECVRDKMAAAKAGEVSSGFGAQPHIDALDVTVPHLLDQYLRHRYDVTSGPDVEYQKEESRPAPPAGAVY